jgi:hypothetical protein
MALLADAAAQISEHHCLAGSQADQTAGSTTARLRSYADRQTDIGRLRSDGDDQEGTGCRRRLNSLPASSRFPPELPSSTTWPVPLQRLQQSPIKFPVSAEPA